MTATFDPPVQLKDWLIECLATTLGCRPAAINLNLSLNDLGLGSRDALVLSGQLSEVLGRAVSPVEFWQQPTINDLVDSLTVPGQDTTAEQTVHREPTPLDEPIAVIGLGCRFPGGICGPEALWQFLGEGRCSIGEVPPERWRPFDDGSPEVAAALARTTRWGSFLSEIDGFDAEFFEIPPREAAKMDPQQRLLLEVAWEALEHAGIPPNSLRRTQTGVFAGACVSEYGYLASTDLPAVDAWSNTGGALSIIANRLSYLLDLRGPSVAVDTACSSSLVAVHLACQSLRMHDSDLAIAAGVNLLFSPAVFRGFDQAGALSRTGRCRAFDAAADGFVRGEGCGVAVLKRLGDAMRDGNRILAMVRGSAVNQDGRSNGLMAPNPGAQMAVLRAAYANADTDPRDVDYVETHGTGTLLGDPIEARALGTVLGRGRPEHSPLLIGAVKTNLGHLEAAAGITGFIKAVLSVQRGQIPASLNFEAPNPHIPFEQLRLRVVAEPHAWPPVKRARRAGVSSFGFGGTNAHVVLEQGLDEAIPVAGEPDPPVSTLVVFGKTPERIASTAGALAAWMTGAGAQVRLADVAHTLNHHRAWHPRFATVCARDHAQAVAGLTALAAGRSAPGVVGPHDGPCGSGTVFVYSGQGSQWRGMGRRLLADEPEFAAAVAELEPVFVEQVGFSLTRVLADGQRVAGDARVQPVLMGLQLALTELWRCQGMVPDAVIGHSMGEVTAAVVAGALAPEEGLRVIAIRSRLMARLAGQGAVASLGLDAATTEGLIANYPAVAVAGFPSPRQTVVAGAPAQVDAVIDAVRRRNGFARRVNMEVASHTAMMDPILPELRAALAELAPKKPVVPFISTVTGTVTTSPLDAEYWVANVRQPVQLRAAIAAAGKDHATFVEISPHPILAQAITETLGEAHHHSVGTLWRDGDDTLSFHANSNATHGVYPPETPHPPEPHPVLPSTPWQHTRHWVDLAPVAHRGARAGQDIWQGPAAGTVNAAIVPSEWSCELAWPAHPLPADDAGRQGSWLVVGDAGPGTGLAAAIGRLLGAGSSVTVLPTNADARALTAALAGVGTLLYAPDVASDPFDARPGYELFHTGRRLVAALLAMASPARLFVLTRNAQPMSAGDRACPAHAVLWGLGRTLALEHPEIWGGLIDVDQSVPARLAATYVLAEADGGDGEDQVVYRAGVRHVPRLQRPTAPPPSGTGVDGAAAHLVIGATGNVGPHLIQQLADMGAGTIVAVSRNPGSTLDELTRALAEKSASLVTVAADASDPAAMTALFDRFGADLPPLAGVYLTAFGGGPVTLRDMSDDDVVRMFAPKLDAVALVHRLSLHQPVAQFVVFTSISGLLGSRWLSHYAATTTFLDSFAYARRAAGLPATAINWGLWKSLADSQTEPHRRVTLESGLEPMPDEAAVQALWSVTGPGAPARLTLVAADWAHLADAYRTRSPLHIIDDLVARDSDNGPGTTRTEFRDALHECVPARRRDLLAEHVSAQVAAAMGLVSAEALDSTVGFFQAGMDSLMSVTLQRALAETLGEELRASVVFDYPTVDALTDYLATLLPELVEAGDSESADAYEELTEDELLQQLSERLRSNR